MRVIPEDHPSKLPLKTPFGTSQPRRPLRSPFGRRHVFPKPGRKPFEISAESPSKSPPKPPSGPSFGKCHLSRKPARKPSLRKPPSKRLRNMPRVPKVKPKDPFEICLMFRSPAESHPLRKLLQNLLRSYLRKVPRVPECRAKNLPSWIRSEPAACPRMPQAGRIPPDAARACHLS